MAPSAKKNKSERKHTNSRYKNSLKTIWKQFYAHVSMPKDEPRNKKNGPPCKKIIWKQFHAHISMPKDEPPDSL